MAQREASRKKERPAQRKAKKERTAGQEKGGSPEEDKERCLRTARFEGSGIGARGSAGKREKQWLAVRGDGES